MNINIEILPKYRMAYVRQVGPYGPANAQVMEKLKQWAKERDLLTESAILLGISQDHPATTRPENCRYDACIVIAQNFLNDGSISESEFVGGRYAVLQIKHTEEAIQKAWNEIFPYLYSSGYQIDNKPILERYIGKMIINDLCEICVPIKPV